MSSSKSPCRRFRLKQIAARLAIAFGTALSAQHVLAAVPVVTTQTPAHTATSVARNPTLSITFDIPVLSGAGSAYLHICKTTTGQCQDITAASGSGLGTATVTYSPAWLEDNAAYYVIVDANAFVDATVPADGFAGITAGNWSFTTGIDAAAPTISNTWPNNNESAASTTATLTIAFSEPVQPGSGNIVIKRTSDDAVIETIAVTDATKVWGWNSSNIAIKHAALAPNTQYYINIDAAAIKDTAGTPNPFAGIGDNSTWTFTTSADLTSPTLTGISGSATATSSTLAITATHDEGGSAIMMVVPAGTTPAPTAAQIWACGGGYTGTISACVGQGMPTGTPQTITASSLQANTAYDLYLIAEDAAGNLSAVASVLNQSTSPAAAPGLINVWPVNGETNTSWAAPWLNLNFDTTVQAGTGNIVIKRSSDNVTVQTISITDTSKVYFNINNNTTVGVQLAALTAGTQYYVNVDNGAIKDLANNSWPGISDATSWSFLTSLDSTAPALSAVGLSGTNQNGTTLSATSNETARGYWIALPAGSTAPAPSQVSACGSGYTAAAVAACGNSKTGMSANTPYSFAVSGLVGDTSYDLYLVAKDSVSNLSALSGPWNFTTLTDTVPPAAIGLSPGNNGVDVSRTASLSVTFDEPVQIGSGNITIYPYPSGTAVETIPVTDAARISVSGSKLWISHSVPLNVNTQYYVTIDAGAIKDMATTPNSFVGIANNSTWAFTTSADATAPTLSALSLSGTTAYATTASITTTEAGFGYLLVVPNGCTAPTAAQLKNPASYTACGTTTYASHDMPAGTSSFTISGLAQNTAYTLHMTGEDNNGNLGNVVSSSFTTLADATAPVLSSVSLSGTFQNGTTLAVTSSEAGDLFLFIVPGGSPSPTAAQLSDGTYSAATVIQNYSIAMPAGTASHNIGNLIGSTAYDLYLAARDMGGNFSALSGPLNFTTANDTVPPVISWLSPGNNTTGYSRFFDLNIGFDEPIQVGSGNITIYPYPSGAAVETIPVTDTARVLVSGNGLSFTHSTPLAAGTQYYVTLDAGAVRDQAATPNSFAGFTTNSTWRFTTTTDVTAPTLTGTGVSAITETGASFSATGDENNSRLWWLATNAGCSAPASLQVMKSEGYAACPVASAGKLGSKMSAGAAVSGTLSGLAAGTAYDLYLVAEDNVGNLSAASLLSFTTASAYSAPAAPPPPATTTAPPPAVDPTIVITPVTDPGTIFENPQDTTATGGVAIIVTPPSTPLVIAPDAPIGAAIQINTTAPIPVVSGTTTLIYQPVTAGTVLQTQAFTGQVGLQVVSGAATVAAPTTGSTIPVVATTQATAALVTKEANTQVTAGRDANQNIVVAVDQGSVDYTLTPAGATAPISFKVFDGETLNVASTGDSQTLRLGSFDQHGNRPGDYIAAIPQASNALQVPILAGTPSRFGEPLLDRISQETASQYGLTPIADRPLAQDRVTGVLTFPTEQGIFRLLPIGPISLIIAPQQRAVSVSDIAANLSAVISASMTFAVAPATAYQDLTNLLRELDPASSMEILGDGVIQVSLAGTQYAAIPDMAVTPGGSTGAGFETANGQLVLRDSAGNRQALHPAFADSEFLLATFRPQMPKVALRYAGNGEYQATLQPGSPPLTLVPDIQLGTPSPSISQAAQPWWQDAAQGKLFIRYPNNISQGFGVR